jgi:hypothetical protein
MQTAARGRLPRWPFTAQFLGPFSALQQVTRRADERSRTECLIYWHLHATLSCDMVSASHASAHPGSDCPGGHSNEHQHIVVKMRSLRMMRTAHGARDRYHAHGVPSRLPRATHGGDHLYLQVILIVFSVGSHAAMFDCDEWDTLV